jgi:hypothetical protein
LYYNAIVGRIVVVMKMIVAVVVDNVKMVRIKVDKMMKIDHILLVFVADCLYS